MSLTKIGSIGINTGIAFAGVTTIVTLNTANDALSIGATVNVGSGITLSKDGDVFFTGIATGNGSGLTALNASNLASGTVPTARLGSGTASSSTFLRGDSTFQTVNTDLVSDTSPQLGGALDTNGNNINFGDSTSNGVNVNRLTFGTGTNGDLALWHDGSNSYIQDQGTGELRIRGAEVVRIQDTDSAENMAVFNKNGAVELYHDNSKKFETISTGVVITGSDDGDGGAKGDFKFFQTDGTLKIMFDASTSQFEFLDNSKASFGNGDDLQIYHDGSHTYANNTTGFFHIRSGSAIRLQKSDGEPMIYAIPDGAVELFHNNVKKFETHDVGTIFTEAGSGATQAAIKVNTTLDTYGSITVRDKRDVDNAIAAFQVENASNGSNETNLLLRSVNLGTTAFAHGIYAARSHRFAVSSNTTPTVQIDSDGLKFNNDQASGNALDDYEEGTFTVGVSVASGSVTLNTSYDQASYTKIGRSVHVMAYLVVSSVSGASGNLSLTGLPFTSANLSDKSGAARHPMTMYLNGSSLPDGQGQYNTSGYINEAVTELQVNFLGTNTSGKQTTNCQNQLGSGSDFFLNFTYIATA